MISIWLPVLTAVLVSALSPLLFRPVLVRRQVLDVPNERSSHVTPTIRGGGLAQLGGVLCALLVLWCLPVDGLDRWTLTAIVIGAAAMSVIGLADDLGGDSGPGVAIRAASQVLVAALLAAALAVRLDGGWLLGIVGAVFIAAYVNIANFMDGVNWMSGLHGAIAGTAFAVVGWLNSLSWLMLAGLVICAAFVVFLPWNVLGAGMFLGDTGSYLLGGLVAGTSFAAILAGVPALAALAPLAIYLGDGLITVVRRAVRGEPVTQSHRMHTYQRLTNVGWNHLPVAGAVTLLSIVTAGIGLASIVWRWPWWATALCLASIVAAYVALPGLLGDRLPPGPLAPLAPAPEVQSIPARPGFTPKRWAVVGASGFIGSATVAELRGAGFEVVGLSAPRLALDPGASDGAEVAELARHDPAVTALVGQLIGVDIVVNAAGLATPDAPATAALYGANALLPAVVAVAAARAGAGRVVQLSSAAVQGRRAVLDETPDATPFSPYSRSKTLGERSLLWLRRSLEPNAPDVVIVRATSVQGDGRGTTGALRRIANSFLASVAAPGTQPTTVSSLAGLTTFIVAVGTQTQGSAGIRLQPWEGHSVADAIRQAGGGREPLVLPAWLCRSLLAVARAGSRVLPEVTGHVRRLELMWLGQSQAETCASPAPAEASLEEAAGG